MGLELVELGTGLGLLEGACGLLRDCAQLFDEDVPCGLTDVAGIFAEWVANNYLGCQSQMQAVPGSWHGFLGTSPDPVKQLWLTRMERLIALKAVSMQAYPDASWHQVPASEATVLQAWRGQLVSSLGTQSEGGARISPAERELLLTTPIPANIGRSTAERLLDRVNRSGAY